MTWVDSWIWYLALVSGILVWIWSILQILTTRYSPAGTTAWLLLIVLMPPAGVPLYAVFGGRKLRKVMRRKHRIHLRRSTVVDVNYTGPIDRLLRGLGIPGATCGNVFTLLPDSAASWAALDELIATAEHSIDLVTYVFKADKTGRGVIARLAVRARNGVKVRLLYDSIGSLATSRKLFMPLRKAGGEVVEFMPTRYWPFRSRTNLRNHRKLLVVDGKRAWSGGMNIGDEYLAGGEEAWADLAFKLEGPAVQPLAELFNMDWSFATQHEPLPPPAPVPAIFNGDEGIVQTVPSGPDVEHDPIYAALLAIAFEAKERLWMITPYFVPDDAALNAITTAARCGVDVRVLVPQKSDNPLVDMVARSYLRQIQGLGVKVYRLRRGMLHAKAVLVDQTVLIGSANLDSRSFLLNYEVMVACEDAPLAAQLAAYVEWLTARSIGGVRTLGRLRETLASTARLLAPLM